MGTVLFERNNEELVKRFYGGEDRGVCFNVNINKVMTKQEFVEFLSDCIKGLDL